MKTFKKHIFWLLLVIITVVSCEENIDPITKVEPGADTGAPIVTISKPGDGLEIQVAEPVTSTIIDFKVVDDIEIESVKVDLDGTEIASFDSFLGIITCKKTKLSERLKSDFEEIF